MIRISLGSAAALGLADSRVDALPTTCYLMLGDKCSMDCAFCSQARSSTSDARFLSRVSWPEFGEEKVLEKLEMAVLEKRVKNVCFQLTNSREAIEKAVLFRRAFSRDAPFCISCNCDAETVEMLFANSFQKVCIALDACSHALFNETKGGSFARSLELLEWAAQRFPGAVATHLIIGLGESEKQAATLIHNLLALNITVGLFAFTPLRGTRLESYPQPELGAYRRVQAALYLMKKNPSFFERLTFDAMGRIADLGLPAAVLREILSDGKAFETSGCEHCNRPFYNERPGGTIYNYPRPLNAEEAEEALNETGLA